MSPREAQNYRQGSDNTHTDPDVKRLVTLQKPKLLGIQDEKRKEKHSNEGMEALEKHKIWPYSAPNGARVGSFGSCAAMATRSWLRNTLSRCSASAMDARRQCSKVRKVRRARP